MLVEPLRLTTVAVTPPIVTVAAGLKPVPMISTIVPPLIEPEVASIMRMVTTPIATALKATVLGLLAALLVNTRFAVRVPAAADLNL
jgi:hypothetical protein